MRIGIFAACVTASTLLAGCAGMPTSQQQTAGEQIGYLPAQLPAKGRKQPLPKQPLAALPGGTGPRTASTEAVIQAIAQLGTPYDWGGSNTKEGFDCSGLTHYIYSAANIDIPRTARAQYRATKHVSRRKLRPGDLVFFRLHGHHVDHVGVYVGNQRFIHAPRTGKHVSFARLNNHYWSRHFVAGGRIAGAHVMELANNR